MRTFRPAPERPTRANLVRTAAMTAAFWLVFVGLLPAGLVHAERAAGLPGFAALPGLGGLVALAMGALNLWSGWALAVAGRGTPFPTDTARELVVVGPYRHVRNPMAVGGLGVAVGLGLALGSWGLLAYAVAGGVLWHLVARPMEERDLAARFGAPYRAYAAAVRCWWPRLAPYAPR